MRLEAHVTLMSVAMSDVFGLRTPPLFLIREKGVRYLLMWHLGGTFDSDLIYEIGTQKMQDARITMQEPTHPYALTNIIAIIANETSATT